MSLKIGRNDPCWCGSGKKYKKCHEAFDEKMEMMKQKGYAVVDRSLIKTPEQIEKIKESCKINIAVLDYVAEHIRPGISTEEIDRWVHEETVRHGGIPAPLNYQGFPKSVCTSLNNEICHGIPDENIMIQDGDIINVDVSTILNGYFSDASINDLYITGGSCKSSGSRIYSDKKTSDREFVRRGSKSRLRWRRITGRLPGKYQYHSTGNTNRGTGKINTNL